MSESRKHRKKIFRSISKIQYLKHILDRFEHEYIQILNLVTEYNIKHKRGMGFWSLIRIIFPVIESVAHAVGKQKEVFLKEDLHVPFGHLVWEMYRHPLMHTDELGYVVYKGKTISWSTHLGNEGLNHFMVKQENDHPATLHLIIPKLYHDLHEFLKKEIAKNDITQIEIQDGVHFPNHLSSLIDELEEIYRKF